MGRDQSKWPNLLKKNIQMAQTHQAVVAEFFVWVGTGKGSSLLNAQGRVLGFAHRIDHIKLDEYTTRKTCCQGRVSRPVNLLFISCFLGTISHDT